MTESLSVKTNKAGDKAGAVANMSPILFVSCLLLAASCNPIEPALCSQAAFSSPSMLRICALVAFVVMLVGPWPSAKSLYVAAGLGVIGSALVAFSATDTLTVAQLAAMSLATAVPIGFIVARWMAGRKTVAPSQHKDS